jgi:hypothetical protein
MKLLLPSTLAILLAQAVQFAVCESQIPLVNEGQFLVGDERIRTLEQIDSIDQYAQQSLSSNEREDLLLKLFESECGVQKYLSQHIDLRQAKT